MDGALRIHKLGAHKRPHTITWHRHHMMHSGKHNLVTHDEAEDLVYVPKSSTLPCGRPPSLVPLVLCEVT
jgi:hypothetical protein